MDGNADGSSGAVHAAEEFASPELKKTAEQYIERDFENVGLEDEEALLPPERKSEISISSHLLALTEQSVQGALATIRPNRAKTVAAHGVAESERERARAATFGRSAFLPPVPGRMQTLAFQDAPSARTRARARAGGWIDFRDCERSSCLLVG